MKKLVLVVVSFFLFAGIVSASSINGDYKGNPIVKVYVNGNEIHPEVPAHIVDGSTFLPMRAIVEAMGAEVTWDSSTYTAQIIKPERDEFKTAQSVVSSAKEVLNEYGIRIKNYIISIDDKGAYVSVGYDMESKSVQQSINDIASIATSALGVRHLTDMLLVSIYNGEIYGGGVGISLSDAQNYLDGKISWQDYISRWKTYQNNSGSFGTSGNSITPVLPSTQPPSLSCGQINQKYDQLKRLKQEELGKRGLGRSSIYDSEMEKIEQNRLEELKANGCSAN